MQLNDLSKITNDPDYLVAKLTLISSMTILGISYGIVLLLVTFMLADTVAGIIKSIALKGWESLDGRIFWIGILTKIGIVIVPFLLALISVVVKALTNSSGSYNFDPLILLVLWTLIANDLISFLTNLLSIRTKRDYKNKDLVALMINALRQLIFKGAKAALENINRAGVCEPDKDEENDRNPRLPESE